MSRLLDLLQPKLAAGFTIPEPLERAWNWMEAQGWGLDNGNGYFLTPYAGTRQLGAVFSADESLDGWFEPGDAGFDQLVPLAQISGDGGTAAAWIDGDQVRFVALGSETFLLADSAVDFLRLLAIGHSDLNSWDLELEPEDEDAVEGHAPFRAWVESEFEVAVPACWTAADPDPFQAWVEGVRG
jgi:hypothetical protein